MRQVLTAAEMRAAEEVVFAAEPGVDLMGRAAAAVAREAEKLAAGGTILVVAGRGNNGGDALFAAARLAEAHLVRLWLPFGAAHEEGLAAARAAGAEEVSASAAMAGLETVALVIDGVAGLGSRPGLPEPVATFAEACAATGTAVLSIDLPSGLGADGTIAGPNFRAAVTVTFAAPKPCHVLLPAAEACGVLRVADIGVDVPETRLRQVEEADVARWWPTPGPTSDKYSRGVVLLDTGSAQYPGAGLLSCSGALHGP